MLLGRPGQPQAGEDLRPDRLPRRAIQQHRPRVGPPQRRRREHVTAAQRSAQLLQHAQHVGVPVDGARRQVRVAVHRAAPHRRHQIVVDLAAAKRALPRPPGRQIRQAAHRREDLLPGRRLGQRQRLGQQHQERADDPVPAGQGRAHRRLASRVVGDELPDDRGRVAHPVAGRHLLDRLPRGGHVDRARARR